MHETETQVIVIQKEELIVYQVTRHVLEVGRGGILVHLFHGQRK